MKELKFFFVLMILSTSFAVFSQEEEEEEEVEEVIVEAVAEIAAEGTETIQATFDGFERDSYSFNYKNEENEDDSIFFQDITPEVLKMYNLKDKKYIGKNFEVTFSFKYENEVDEDGDKQEFIKRRVTGLKLLN
ncbi:hypothetical protein [Aquimarina sp. SS2-1]|uniref:hypothetical protein n=1 Tax=Aquimarina besae TaxID=3342247 RepID=UPI003672832B